MYDAFWIGLAMLAPAACWGAFVLFREIRQDPTLIKWAGRVISLILIPIGVITTISGLVHTSNSAKCDDPKFAAEMPWCETTYNKGPK